MIPATRLVPLLTLLMVASAQAQPVLSLVSPLADSAWTSTGGVPIRATVAGLDAATVEEVEYFVDGVSIGSDDTAPFELDWAPANHGTYTLTATATLSAGGPLDAAPVSVTVGCVRGEALLVLGFLPLTVGDQAISDRLATWGYKVAPILARPSTGAEATGKALVFISETVSSSDVASKYRTTTTPVLCAEDYNYDEMAMTGPTIDTHYGFVANQTALVVEEGGSPLSAGLPPGRTTIFTAIGRMQWGIPNANATIGATLDGDATKPVVFGYRTGALMEGGLNAPARRTGFFLQGFTQEMTLLNDDGLALFDAAVRWTGGKETDTQPTAPTDLELSVPEPGQVQLSWTLDPQFIDGTEMEESIAGGPFHPIGRFAPDVTTARHRLDNQPGSRAYRLRSWNGNGYSAPTAEVETPAPVSTNWGVQ